MVSLRTSAVRNNPPISNVRNKQRQQKRTGKTKTRAAKQRGASERETNSNEAGKRHDLAE
jgi:hypothetical protein